MEVVDVNVAQTHLSRLVEKACAGEEVVITRDSRPVVRLVPIQQPIRREFGALKGKMEIPEMLFRALSDEELDAWER